MQIEVCTNHLLYGYCLVFLYRNKMSSQFFYKTFLQEWIYDSISDYL